MRQYVFAAALLAAPAALAEEAEGEKGRSLMQEGARLFVEGLMREMEPAIEDLEGMASEIGPAMRDFALQMGPALRDLMDEVEDWSRYHPPEVLPNGDIILRRKSDAEMAEENDPVDL